MVDKNDLDLSGLATVVVIIFVGIAVVAVGPLLILPLLLVAIFWPKG